MAGKEPVLLTVPEVADIMRLHIDTVKLQLRQGKIPGFKQGKAWRIPKSAIDELTQRKPAATEAGDDLAVRKTA